MNLSLESVRTTRTTKGAAESTVMGMEAVREVKVMVRSTAKEMDESMAVKPRP